MELWKPIACNNKYEASTEGRIRNASTKHILTSHLNNCGYKMVTLYGGQSSRLVHRLVAETWIENPDNLPIVEHKDDNPLNCSIDNLMWSTQKDNLGREHRTSRINDYYQSDEWKSASAKKVGKKHIHNEEYIDKYLNDYTNTVENYRLDYYNGLSMKDLRKKYGATFIKDHPLKHTNRRAYMALLQEIIGCNVSE